MNAGSIKMMIRATSECFAKTLQNKAVTTIGGMKAPHDDIDVGVSDYQSKLYTDIPLPFDLVILGMGNDGHTASWFPDAAELSQAMDVNSEQLVVTTRPASQPLIESPYPLCRL